MTEARTHSDSGRLEFGIFDWIDQSQLDLSEIFEQRLKMLEYADQAGFFCYHLAEHHGTPLCLAPSPGLFLAAVAQRTRRLRLGPLVYLLPLYPPLRLIEEICMLDHLSGGRLELGVGRGVSPFELAMYNVDAEESRAIFHEVLGILIQGLTTGEVSHEGHYFTFRDVRLPLRPLQQPYPPLWYPTENPDTFPWVAKERLNTVVHYPPMTVIRERFDLYKRTLEETSHDSSRLNSHVSNPKYGIVRHVYVAETDAQALKEAKAGFADFFYNFNYLWALHGSDRHRRLADFEARIADGLHIVGSPATVRSMVKEHTDITGANYFVGSFAFGTLSTEQILNSLRLFAEEVMPAFRNRE